MIILITNNAKNALPPLAFDIINYFNDRKKYAYAAPNMNTVKYQAVLVQSAYITDSHMTQASYGRGHINLSSHAILHVTLAIVRIIQEQR